MPTSLQIFQNNTQWFAHNHSLEIRHSDNQTFEDFSRAISAIYQDIDFLKKKLLTDLTHPDLAQHYSQVWHSLPSSQQQFRVLDKTTWQYCVDHLDCHFLETSSTFWQSNITTPQDYHCICLFMNWTRLVSRHNRSWLILYEFIMSKIFHPRPVRKSSHSGKSHTLNSSHIGKSWFKTLVYEFYQLFNNSIPLNTNDNFTDWQQNPTTASFCSIKLHDILYAGLVDEIVSLMGFCALDISLFLLSSTSDQIYWRLWQKSRSDRNHQFRNLVSGFQIFKPYESLWPLLLEIHKKLSSDHQQQTNNEIEITQQKPETLNSIVNCYHDIPLSIDNYKRSSKNIRKKLQQAKKSYIKSFDILQAHTGISHAYKSKYIDIPAHYYTWRFIKRSNFLTSGDHSGWFKILLIKNNQILNTDSCVRVPDCTQWDNLLAFALDLGDPLTELDLISRINWRFDEYHPTVINIGSIINRRRDSRKRKNTIITNPHIKYLDNLISAYRQYTDKKIKNLDIRQFDLMYNDEHTTPENDNLTCLNTPPWQKKRVRKTKNFMTWRKIKNQLNQKIPEARLNVLKKYTNSSKLTKMWLQQCLGPYLEYFSKKTNIVDIDYIRFDPYIRLRPPRRARQMQQI